MTKDVPDFAVVAGNPAQVVNYRFDPETIEALVRELNGPLTVVMGLQGSSLNVKQLESLGVRRITIGGSLARTSFGLIRKAAAEMFDSGSFSFADEQIPPGRTVSIFCRST